MLYKHYIFFLRQQPGGRLTRVQVLVYTRDCEHREKSEDPGLFLPYFLRNRGREAGAGLSCLSRTDVAPLTRRNGSYHVEGSPVLPLLVAKVTPRLDPPGPDIDHRSTGPEPVDRPFPTFSRVGGGPTGIVVMGHWPTGTPYRISGI